MVVVLGIIAVVAACLFPVLVTARESAQKATCMSNLRQIGRGTQLYVADYDDRLVPVNYSPNEVGTSRNDRTWVQSLLPYVRSFAVFRCPSDGSARLKSEATFDQDLIPGDTDSKYYSASMRTNYGYNYQYMSPVIKEGDNWVARPRLMTDVANPSTTLLFADSVWEHDPTGQPMGGGNWLIVPPCRYYQNSVDSFSVNSSYVYTPVHGWKVDLEGEGALFGNAWPRHLGRLNVSRLDGSVRSAEIRDLVAGCDIRDGWKGTIRDTSAYIWDVR